MRILHTSDWHLGRSLHGLDLLIQQRAFVESLSDMVKAQSVDCVVIAGDVFDKAFAPVEAVRLFSDALAELSQHCTVIVTSGNHDSAIRLGAGASLFRDGVHVITEPLQVGEPIEIVADNVHVRVYPIPYLDPDHCRVLFGAAGDPLPRSHEAVMAAAVKRIWARDQELPGSPDARIAIAHAFVTGGERSDSERDICVGGVDAIPAEVFADFDYVALGHLHGPQRVASATKTVLAYSGSPIRYSFSEARQSKSVTFIDVDSRGVHSISMQEVTQPKQMATIVGTLAEVVTPEQLELHADSWVKVTVTDAARPAELLEVVRAAYPHALVITHQPADGVDRLALTAAEIDLRDPVSVSQEFINDVTSAAATEEEVLVIRQAYEVARGREIA